MKEVTNGVLLTLQSLMDGHCPTNQDGDEFLAPQKTDKSDGTTQFRSDCVMAINRKCRFDGCPGLSGYDVLIGEMDRIEAACNDKGKTLTPSNRVLPVHCWRHTMTNEDQTRIKLLTTRVAEIHADAAGRPVPKIYEEPKALETPKANTKIKKETTFTSQKKIKREVNKRIVNKKTHGYFDGRQMKK